MGCSTAQEGQRTSPVEAVGHVALTKSRTSPSVSPEEPPAAPAVAEGDDAEDPAPRLPWLDRTEDAPGNRGEGGGASSKTFRRKPQAMRTRSRANSTLS
jgi:hypothetical protein